MASPAPLALLHPSDPPATGLVLGSGCPPELAPSTADAAAAVQLVVIAPAAAEAHDERWLTDAWRQAADRLSPTGIVVAWGGPPGRRRIAAAGAAAGLAPDLTVLSIPRRSTLVVPSSGLLRRAGEIAVGGLVLKRRREDPVLGWLDDRAHRGCIIRRSRRTGSVVVDTAAGVHAKVAADAAAEYERLAELGPAARDAGAGVPAPRLVRLAATDALVHPRLPGRTAAQLLRWRRVSPAQVIRDLGRWLEAWGQSTHRRVRFDESAAWAELFADGALLAPLVGDDAIRRLRDECDAHASDDIAVVAAHRDLTMWNVLLRGDGLGVVDWQAATNEGLPLGDLVYAAVDAVAAARRYRISRVEALQAAEGVVAPLRARLVRSLDLSEHEAALATRACWIHHAANEQRRPDGDARPFLELARRSLAG